MCRAVEAMQGSTVEAMADALDGAFCVCFGISKECKSVDAFSIDPTCRDLKSINIADKESANCRLEAMCESRADRPLAFGRAFPHKGFN